MADDAGYKLCCDETFALWRPVTAAAYGAPLFAMKLKRAQKGEGGVILEAPHSIFDSHTMEQMFALFFEHVCCHRPTYTARAPLEFVCRTEPTVITTAGHWGCYRGVWSAPVLEPGSEPMHGGDVRLRHFARAILGRRRRAQHQHHVLRPSHGVRSRRSHSR